MTTDYQVFFVEERLNDDKYWELCTGEPIECLDDKERSYLEKRIRMDRFNQPREDWLGCVLDEFKMKMNPDIARFLNERGGKVISTMDLQMEFDGHFYLDSKNWNGN